MILFLYEIRIEPSAWGWDLWNACQTHPSLSVAHQVFEISFNQQEHQKKNLSVCNEQEILKHKCWTRSENGILNDTLELTPQLISL